MKQENLNWTIVLKDKDLPKNFEELKEYCNSKHWIFSSLANTIDIGIDSSLTLFYNYETQSLDVNEHGLESDGDRACKTLVTFNDITTEQVCIIAEGFLIRKPIVAISKLKAEISYFERTKDTLIHKYNFDRNGEIIKIYDEDIAIREQRLKELGGW